MDARLTREPSTKSASRQMFYSLGACLMVLVVLYVGRPVLLPIALSVLFASQFAKTIEILYPVLEPLASAAMVVMLVIFLLICREDARFRMISLMGDSALTGTTRLMTDTAERVSSYLLNLLRPPSTEWRDRKSVNQRNLQPSTFAGRGPTGGGHVDRQSVGRSAMKGCFNLTSKQP